MCGKSRTFRDWPNTSFGLRPNIRGGAPKDRWEVSLASHRLATHPAAEPQNVKRISRNSTEAFMVKNRKSHKGRRDPIPETDNVEVLSEFWDTHSVADYWDEFQPVEVEFDIDSMLSRESLPAAPPGKMARLT